MRTPTHFQFRELVLTGSPEIMAQGNGVEILDNSLTTSLANNTDFGSTSLANGAVLKIFSIRNIGDIDLSLTGAPLVEITGAAAGDFTISQNVFTPIPSGAGTTLSILFNPSAAGLRTATVSIQNNDGDENPFNFAIAGTGLLDNPEIRVLGSGVEIVNGDNTPSLADDTDFGVLLSPSSSGLKTYTIENSGPDNLSLSGMPTVRVMGTHATDFRVTAFPSSAFLLAGESTTFTVMLSPNGIGERTATIEIENNDLDEAPYTFDVKATVMADAPEMDVFGNSVEIVDEDMTPSLTDHTDYGSAQVGGSAVVRTYTIENNGTGNLNLVADPFLNYIVIAGTHADDFSVSQQPAGVINQSGSTTFSIAFNPSGGGLRSAIINIRNNDSDEDRYVFYVEGVGLLPEIEVSGNSVNIVNGDVTPSISDSTDFGNLIVGSSAILNEFIIDNSGDGILELDGTPLISLSGPDSGEFSVNTSPSSASIASSSSDSFTLAFDPTSPGTKTAIVSISNNDTDENPFSFTITGLAEEDPDSDDDDLLDSEEVTIYGTDPFNPDTDGDEVEDGQEVTDGTDPLDSGSFVERLGRSVCMEWNGFLHQQVQILEHRNTSGVDIAVETTLFNLFGEPQETVPFILTPGQQFDIIANDMQGFVQDSYGLVCSTITSGPDNSLAGQLVIYDFEVNTFDLAWSVPFDRGKRGIQCLQYNSFFPTMDASQLNNTVGWFLQIANREDVAQSGILFAYDPFGNEIRRQNVTLLAKERRDIDLNDIGSNAYGMVCWEPNADGRARVSLNRYYFDGGYDLSRLLGVSSFVGIKGTGVEKQIAFDTRGRLSVLELSNTLDIPVVVSLSVFDQLGSFALNSPSLVTVPAKASHHIILNTNLPSGLGSVVVDGSERNSVISSLVEYSFGSNGGFQSASSDVLVEGTNASLRGSYNNFLGGCVLRLTNFSLEQSRAEITMTRYDQSLLLDKHSLDIPSQGAAELNLCENETQFGYGSVLLDSAGGNVSGNVVRSNADGSYEFSSRLKR